MGIRERVGVHPARNRLHFSPNHAFPHPVTFFHLYASQDVFETFRGSGRLLYQISYGKDVFSYAESLVSDVPVVREIYNGLKFLSDEIREVTRYILDT